VIKPYSRECLIVNSNIAVQFSCTVLGSTIYLKQNMVNGLYWFMVDYSIMVNYGKPKKNGKVCVH
jgi:hypothetical protein